MIADKVIIHGKTINIHTYPRTIGGVQYMYYRARLPKGNGDYLSIQATSIEEVKNQIYFQYNVHAFTPGYNCLDTTIGEALPVWIDIKYSGGRPGTYIRNKSEAKNHILPHLAKIKVRELKQADVQQSMDYLSQILAPSTVHSICSLLRMFMQDYVDRHEIPYNPVMNIRLPVIVTEEIIPLTPDETKTLLEGLEEIGFRPLFAFTLLTAMRIGEVRGLTWDCVDFVRQTISIKQQMIREALVIVPYVKNNNPKTVHFPKVVFDILREVKLTQERRKKDVGEKWSNQENLVFTDETGTGFRYNKLLRAFKSVAVNMGRPNTRIHDLRHTMLSYIWENTHDIEDVLLVSRHKNPLSASVYLHPTRKTQEEAALLISQVATQLNVLSQEQGLFS